MIISLLGCSRGTIAKVAKRESANYTTQGTNCHW